MSIFFTHLTCQDACIERGEDCTRISCSAEHAEWYYSYDCSDSCYVWKNLTMVDGNTGFDVFIKKPTYSELFIKVILKSLF